MARIPCPDCGGFGRVAYKIPGVPPELCVRSSPCERCWPRDENGKKKFWADGTEGTIEVDDDEEFGEWHSKFVRLVEEMCEKNETMTIHVDNKPIAVVICSERYNELMENFVMVQVQEHFPGAKEVDG